MEFYRQVAPSLDAPPLVRCLAAPDRALVLEDLRATHDHRPWPLPPTPEQSEHAVDALARVHATLWESPALGDTLGRPHTVDSLRTMVQGIAAHLPGFMHAVGGTLPQASRQAYERVFSSSLAPWMRLTDPRALTVAHGDAHAWNFLFPSAGGGPAVLIDWQLWHLDVGARDLAFFMALHWYPSWRKELERPLLQRYHERIRELGATGYSFDDLWLDYRRCAVRNLTIPVLFWSRGMAPEGWWHRLECAVAAYRDLECEELV
jgi:aminoglycoside/choline kinase family phosphotransferase